MLRKGLFYGTRLFILLAQIFDVVPNYCVVIPEQIHLSLGDDPKQMVVTWVTFTATEDSFVWYGTLNNNFQIRAQGFSKVFVDGGQSRKIRYVHKVTLQDLEPHNFYVYRCGSYQGISEPYIFKTSPIGSDWSPRLLIYGDMGWKGAAIFPFILKETSKYDVDAIVHVGDIAYNMDTSNGKVGDEFLRMIQPVASSVPYMTIAGNHEQAYNFSHYRNKFSMPGRSDGIFYSFNLGPVHFVAISTEVYYFTQYGHEQILTQYHWLEKDLKEASSSYNRVHRPWIIVFLHRPLYCSSDTQEDCSFDENILKCCYIGSCKYGLEDLFHENRVDVTFSGHMHYYERSWPLYHNHVYNGSFKEPYRNPGSVVHIITGAAGMDSGTETASYVRRDWFPFFSSDNSYTVLTIANKTHLHIEQISTNKGGKIIDAIWLIKDQFRNDF